MIQALPGFAPGIDQPAMVSCWEGSRLVSAQAWIRLRGTLIFDEEGEPIHKRLSTCGQLRELATTGRTPNMG
jgi:hypothetical protein